VRSVLGRLVLLMQELIGAQLRAWRELLLCDLLLLLLLLLKLEELQLLQLFRRDLQA